MQLKYTKYIFLFLLINFLSIYLDTGLKSQDSKPQLHVKKTNSKITVDGILEESEWGKADKADNFWQQYPADTSYAQVKTEVHVTYDEDFIYLGFKCMDIKKGGYVTPSLRRDFMGNHNDIVSVLFDPFRNKTNATLFGINPYGVKREALISSNSGMANRGNQSLDFNLSWDSKWYSEAKIGEKGWTAEMAIPFKTLRFEEGSKVWKVNFTRLDSKTAERSSWDQMDKNQISVSPAFGGHLIFEEPLEKPGLNISLIPYVSGGISKDFNANGQSQYKRNIGGDAKIVLTPSLNLDVTVNPDFSQIEVDQQQTNITRYELRLPEKRQFFLENKDLFSNFGTSTVRPFFSRRIGIAHDNKTGLNVLTKIRYGARLSGKINKNWRMGLMNMQTDNKHGILPYNYTVLALQRQVFSRSNISFIAINRQATSKYAKDSTLNKGFDSNNYNRVLGLDYNLASLNNNWKGKFFFHQSYTSNSTNVQNFAHGAGLSYSTPAVALSWDYQYVGKNYKPETGFVTRKDYLRTAPVLKFSFYPKKNVVRHSPGIETEWFYDQDYRKTDHQISCFYEVLFNNKSEILVAVQNEYTLLVSNFNPTRKGIALPQGSDYNYTNVKAEFESDKRKKFYYELETQLGGFFNGSLYRIAGNMNYRFQPYGIASLNYAYNRIQLPSPYSSANIFLIGPRFDITFSKKVFLTTFFQYNNQINNININARLQYRFRPVSDFFIVYTDNYFPDNFKVKNRALVAKLSYWF
jgi:DNA-binding cell septation regulator SpoVG